jgi:hypothetical protein
MTLQQKHKGVLRLRAARIGITLQDVIKHEITRANSRLSGPNSSFVTVLSTIAAQDYRWCPLFNTCYHVEELGIFTAAGRWPQIHQAIASSSTLRNYIVKGVYVLTVGGTLEESRFSQVVTTTLAVVPMPTWSDSFHLCAVKPWVC